ncbi:hypothetical protein ACFFQF_29230 [Haladaptatus pallidirubidus]|nr:hypothetical protein [Haladaptatus pallidirubidus]
MVLVNTRVPLFELSWKFVTVSLDHLLQRGDCLDVGVAETVVFVSSSVENTQSAIVFFGVDHPILNR